MYPVTTFLYCTYRPKPCDIFSKCIALQSFPYLNALWLVFWFCVLIELQTAADMKIISCVDSKGGRG